MSKLNRVILTLCVTGVVIFLFVFPFYVTVSVFLIAVFVFLYTDYKKQQSNGRRVPSHALWLNIGPLQSYANSLEFLRVRSFWRKISLNMQKYYIGLVNQSSGNKDLNVPSHTRPLTLGLSLNSRKLNRPTSVNSIRSVANLDENRPRRASFFIPNSNYSFNVSPIRPRSRLDESSTASEFRNLSISDMESSVNLRIRNQSLSSMKGLPGSSGSNRKLHNGRASPKNIQSIAGPLLASTRYNLSLDSAAYTDVTSTGLCSRVVRYATESGSKPHPATHQRQYSGPGQFPTVQLGKTSRLPIVTKSHVVGRSPVRIRIAPPEFSERRNYISPDPTHLHLSSGSPSLRSSLDRLQEISRPDRLQEGPRKRLHATLGETEDEATKKQRVSDSLSAAWNSVNTEDASTSKRGREESPKEDSQTKRTKNNEIFSSLSSSLNLRAGNNKRKQTIEEWSQSGTPMPVGKQAKKSSPSPENLTTANEQADAPPQNLPMELETTPLTSKTTIGIREPPGVDHPPVSSRIGSTPTIEERLPTLTKMTASPMQGLLYRPSDVSGWVTTETFPESETTAKEKAKLAGDDLKNQRELDAKRRLSSMMFIVGDKEQPTQKDLTPTPSFTSIIKPVPSMPSFSTSTPTPILSTAKSTPHITSTFQETLSTPKSLEKRVHFADNLTQIKTFTSSTDSGEAGASTQPLVGLFGVGSQSITNNSVDSNKSLNQTASLQTTLGAKDSPPTASPSNNLQEPHSGSTLFAFGTPKAQVSESGSSVTSGMGENADIKFGGASSTMPTFGGEKKAAEVTFASSVPTSQNAAKLSTGFSFGTSATSSSITVPGFGMAKPSPVASTFSASAPMSTSAASGQNTNSTPVFGQSVLEKSSPVLAASGQISSVSTTFSQNTPILSTTFGQSTESSPSMFGQKTSISGPAVNLSTPSSTTTFGVTGTTPNTPIMFGPTANTSGQSSTTPLSSGFGAVATPSKTTFGPGSPATFGGLTQPSSGFSGLSSFNTSKDKVAPSPLFGTPPTTTSAPSGFSAPAEASTGSGFGMPSSGSGFGTPMSGGGFSAPSAGGGFGTASAAGGFGMPVVSKPASTNLFSFGAATTAQSQTPGFNSGSQINPIQTGFGGFGSSTTQTATAFGGKPTVQVQQGGFSFGGSSNANASPALSNPMFGAKSDPQISSPSFSLGGQNVSTNAQNASTGGGQEFKIDFSQTSKPNVGSALFGGMASSNAMVAGSSFSDVSKQAANTTHNSFQFGASSAKPFSFGSSSSNENTAPNTLFGSASPNTTPALNTQNTSNAFGQSVFGSQVQQPSSTAANLTQQKSVGLFSFGGGNIATQQQPTSFAFGGSAGPAQSGGFAFGGASSQGSQAKPAGGFAFGGSSTVNTTQTTQSNPFGQAVQSQPVAAPSAFQFGSASSVPSGGFNFGGSASNTPAPAFGAGSANNTFQMGTVPQPQPQGQGQGMFSIGSGSAAPRARTARLMRRQR